MFNIYWNLLHKRNKKKNKIIVKITMTLFFQISIKLCIYLISYTGLSFFHIKLQNSLFLLNWK